MSLFHFHLVKFELECLIWVLFKILILTVIGLVKFFRYTINNESEDRPVILLHPRTNLFTFEIEILMLKYKYNFSSTKTTFR